MGEFGRYSEKTEENPIWLVGLSDIMTNLMLFFLILYVFSIQESANAQDAFANGFDKSFIEQEKERKALEVVQKYEEQDLAKKLAEEMARAGLQDLTDVQMTEEQIKINIAAPVLFQSGRAEPGRGSVEILGVVAKVLKHMQNDIIVEGHTDSVPIKSGDYATNWELSAARANAVVDILASRYGIPQEQLIAAAYGEYRPVASNETVQGRALNRRIEIIISRK